MWTIEKAGSRFFDRTHCPRAWNRLSTWMGDQIRILRFVIITFVLFSPPQFSKAILRTAELPSLCNVVSSIYEIFIPYFAMAVFMCIYLHYRINKQRDTSFEFSSILSTIAFSKHLITAYIIRKFTQLVNFGTFNVFIFFFGNRVRLNLNERALSGNELFC